MNLDLRFYWKLLLRRFPAMALLFTLCTALGAFTALRLPETYRTSARLLVEEPQIPTNMVASTVRTDATEQLDIIQQRLLTRANLIDIANRFDVYEDMREVEPDLIVQRMTRDTSIRRTAGRDRATIMTITFNGRSGQVVANVVNEYVTLVLEANTSFRMDRAGNTLDFFRQEVDRLAVELDEQSIAISAFKSENAAALPENQSYRLGRQRFLQDRLANLERDVRGIENEREELQAVFDSTGQVGPTQQQSARATPEQRQLLVARTDLQQALLDYTPENPRVERLQSIVDRLEAIVASQTSASAQSLGGEDEEQLSPAEVMFRTAMIRMEARLASVLEEIDTTQAELDLLESAIAQSSINGQTLDALQRDFNVIQTRYSAAVSNLNEAQIGERIETTAQGQRISVVETANAPRLPSGPDRTKIIALGAAVGSALAGGLFVLLEVLNRSIRRPVELVSRFNVTPLATIPYMETSLRKSMRRLVLITGSLIAIIGVPLILWYIDRTYLPLDLLVQRALSRLGIM